jgi:hypothetical protein
MLRGGNTDDDDKEEEEEEEGAEVKRGDEWSWEAGGGEAW